MASIRNDVEKVILSEEEIASKVKELGDVITKDYEGRNLLIVGILKGSCVFMTDLIRCIDLDCSIDFMRVSSYGSGTRSTGSINIELDLRCPIKDYDVLIVEDIIDSGLSLSYLIKLLKDRNPKSLNVCVCFDKPERRKKEVETKYTGFVIPDEFVVGYGLDVAEKFRQLDSLYSVKAIG